VNRQGYFVSGENRLYYSAGIPTNGRRRTGIVFVHALDGNRLGPHRMFVELARRFEHIGYCTLRFDLSGCGDSTGLLHRQGIDGEIADVANAVRFFLSLERLEHIVLLGISRGARVCCGAATRHGLPLAGLILLSPPVSTMATGLSSLADSVRGYLYRLAQPAQLGKLVRREVNLRRIAATLVNSVRLSRRYRPVQNHPVSKSRVLLVYGQRDPTASRSATYYEAWCRQNALPYESHIIAGANHSFFHYNWKRQILALSAGWLARLEHG